MFNFVIFLDKDRNKKRTLMQIVEVTPEGYNSVIRFDTDTYAKSQGKTRRWLDEHTSSQDGLAILAFRGAK